MRKVEWVKFLRFIHRIHMVNLFCSHQGFLAGSTPEPNRRYSTPPHNLVSRTSSALSPSLQRRISTNTSSSFYLKNKGRRFNVQLKKGEENQWIPVISTLSDSYSSPSPLICIVSIMLLVPPVFKLFFSMIAVVKKKRKIFSWIILHNYLPNLTKKAQSLINLSKICLIVNEYLKPTFTLLTDHLRWYA